MGDVSKENLQDQIKVQGDVVRQLKSAKAPKEKVITKSGVSQFPGTILHHLVHVSTLLWSLLHMICRHWR